MRRVGRDRHGALERRDRLADTVQLEQRAAQGQLTREGDRSLREDLPGQALPLGGVAAPDLVEGDLELRLLVRRRLA